MEQIAVAFPVSPDRSKVRLGWAVGAGVETPITKQWLARLEYMYLGLGTDVYNVNGFAVPVSESGHMVRLALSYKF
jgi:outer membrane immunogenic protein